MRKGKQKEKLIGEDKASSTQHVGLVPNKSYDDFLLGDPIDKYLSLPHEIEFEYSYGGKTYYFFDAKVYLVTTKGGIISTIKCYEECYWKGKNLIGLRYEDFLSLSGQQPDKEEILYVMVSSNRGQNQKVYDFDDLGLMLWTWRGKIKEILIYNLEFDYPGDYWDQ